MAKKFVIDLHIEVMAETEADAVRIAKSVVEGLQVPSTVPGRSGNGKARGVSFRWKNKMTDINGDGQKSFAFSKPPDDKEG